MFLIYCKTEKGKRQFKPFEKYFLENDEEYYISDNIKKLKKYIKINKSNNLIIGQIDEFIIAYFLLFFYRKHINFIYRSRGILPEESFLRNRSYLRKKILDYLEKSVIKKSDYILTVSKEQEKHFIKKYKLRNKKYITIHNYLSKSQYLFNSVIKDNNQEIEIVYLGSLSKWQSFDKIIKLFKNMNLKSDNVKFLVCVDKKDIRAVKEIFISNYIKNFEVINLSHDELIRRVSSSDVGIILRDDNIINKVASPFKVIDYIQANIPIIMSNNIGDYDYIFKSQEFIYQVDFKNIDNEADNILKFIYNIKSNLKYREKIYHFAINNLNIDEEIRKTIISLREDRE